MKLPYPVTPARRDIPNGYEVDFAERDIIPIRFDHALAAVLILPVVAFIAFVIARLVFSIPS